jgi:hypothetical protein
MARSSAILIRFLPAEFNRVKEAARRAKEPTAILARNAILKVTDKLLGSDPYLGYKVRSAAEK